MAWPFLEPVREADAPGYYKVVTRPMGKFVLLTTYNTQCDLRRLILKQNCDPEKYPATNLVVDMFKK